MRLRRQGYNSQALKHLQRIMPTARTRGLERVREGRLGASYDQKASVDL